MNTSNPTHSSTTTFQVPASLQGSRLDKAIVSLANVSRAQAKELLTGEVRVNGRRAVKGAVVQQGDTIEIKNFDANLKDPSHYVLLENKELKLDVKLETPEIIVVCKPPHLPSAPLVEGERNTLANALVAQYPELRDIGDDKREAGLIHRLDTETSGLVLVARTPNAYRELREALRSQKIEKRYMAIVAIGQKSTRATSVHAFDGLADEGEIQLPIAPHPKDHKRVFACAHPRDVQRLSPRNATTFYRVVTRWHVGDAFEGTEYALVDVKVSRALRHQIRVHFAALGAPLVGDNLYGGPASPLLNRHALHASYMEYKGGLHVSPFVVEAPLPEDMAQVLEQK